MIDRRETILARLVAIMQTIPGVVAVYRNNPNPNEGQMPSVVVFDADEELAPLPETHRYKGATAPVFLSMKPELFICLRNNATNPGTKLNELRTAIYKAIVGDAALVSAVTASGRIELRAIRTGFAVGRSLAGEMKIEIAFTYPLIFDEL